MSILEEIKYEKEIELLIKVLKKLGYDEITNGTISADIIIKNKYRWFANRYFEKLQRKR